MFSALLAGAGLGLLSIPHCAAMCGPLSQAACSRSAQRYAPLHYQAGRIVGYAFVGALSGHLGRAVATVALARWLPLLITIATGSALVLLAGRVWRATQAPPSPLIALGRGAPTLSLWTRWQRLLPQHAAAFGMSTALLPCGALAAALLVAAHHADPANGALSMVAFAVASAPGTLVVAWLLQKLPALRSPQLLRATAVLLVALAALLIARPLYHWAASDPTADTTPAHCH